MKYQVGFGLPLAPEMFVDALPANVTSSRSCYGSADMNKLYGIVSDAKLDASQPPTKTYDGQTFVFNRTEILGELCSHVYLLPK